MPRASLWTKSPACGKWRESKPGAFGASPDAREHRLKRFMGWSPRLKVAVLMSGGIDSSVAAALLAEEGHQVVGFTLKLGDGGGEENSRKTCCAAVMARDAAQVCALLGIPHYTVDLGEDFRRQVINSFEEEYLRGRTPNPCVTCNSLIKWGRAWIKARMMGMEYLATGHYARIELDASGPRLLKGLDRNKDQSYFLWGIPRHLLAQTIFPLGEMNKSEARAFARRLCLPVADKDESQEVCFLPNDDYRAWLTARRKEIAAGSLSGEMVDGQEKIIGRHYGYPFFTIGQRKKLGLGGGRKLFVTRIEPETKRVFVGEEDDLLLSEFSIEQVNILHEQPFAGENGYSVKIRYRDPGAPARVERKPDGRFDIIPAQPLKAVTPGQSAVIYRGEEVVAGGVIMSWEKNGVQS